MSIDRNFPSTRLRRLRKSANLRAMLAETQLTVSDLIQPIFIKENLSGREAIETMPGIDRLGLDIVNEEIDDIIQTGIKSVAVFPVIDESKKDETGTQAAIEENFINGAIRNIKEGEELTVKYTFYDI